MNLIIAAFGCSLLAPSFAQATPDTPPAPIALELVEPDWTQIGSGNYSPWVVDEAGNQVWNPSKSFNNWLATIPDEDKAWPILVDLRYKHDALFSNDLLRVFAEDVGDYNENGIDDWQEVSELYASADALPIMDQIAQLMSKPSMGHPLFRGTDPYSRRVFKQYGLEDYISEKENSNPSLMECSTEHLSITMDTTDFAVGYLSYIASQGELEAFTQYSITIYRGSLLTAEFPRLISTLVALASQRKMLELLRWALFTHGDKFTEEQLAQFDHAIAHYTVNQLKPVVEQLQFHDTARRIYNIPEMTRTASIYGFGPPLSTPYEQLPEMVRTILALYDMPLNVAHESSKMYPFDNPREPKWFAEMDKFKTLDYPMDPIGRRLLDMMMPAIGRATTAIQGHRADTQAMRLAIAAHRHKLRHGSFPTSIGDFDQDLINFAFIDPFVGGNMIYRLDPEIGPMIYARGYDGDDDQGRHERNLFLSTREKDGDFLYYPNPWTTQEIAEDED